MIKRALTAIILFCVLAAVGCREENPDAEGAISGTAQGAQAHTPSQHPSADSTAYDSLIAVLLALESAILADRENPHLAGPLLQVSFDTSSGCFLTVGKGVRNPDHPEGAQREGQKMAARRRAEYWAMYLKAWRRGKRFPYNRKIAGKITYSKQLHRQERGDTLIVLMQTPHGSVILDLPD